MRVKGGWRGSSFRAMRRQSLDAGPMARMLDGSRFLQLLPPWEGKSKQRAISPGPQRFPPANHAGSVLSWTFPLAPVAARLIGFVHGCARGGTGDDAALSWLPPPSWGGIVRSTPNGHASPRPRGRPYRPATWVRCPIGRRRRGGGPDDAPRAAGEPGLARRGTRLDGPSTGYELFSRLHMHPRWLPSFAFCVPDGVKRALPWLGSVSHIFGRWDSILGRGAVINAHPPRPKLR
jgi:hypothetical protein